MRMYEVIPFPIRQSHVSLLRIPKMAREWNHGSSFNQLLTFLTNPVAGKIHWNTSHCTRTRHWQNKWEMPQNKKLNIDSFHLRLARSPWKRLPLSTTSFIFGLLAWWVRPTDLQDDRRLTEDWTWKRTMFKRSRSNMSNMSNQAESSWSANLC